MIDKTKKDFVMISQWGIGKSGRGVWFFDHLKHGKLNYYTCTYYVIFKILICIFTIFYSCFNKKYNFRNNSH